MGSRRAGLVCSCQPPLSLDLKRTSALAILFRTPKGVGFPTKGRIARLFASAGRLGNGGRQDGGCTQRVRRQSPHFTAVLLWAPASGEIVAKRGKPSPPLADT